MSDERSDFRDFIRQHKGEIAAMEKGLLDTVFADEIDPEAWLQERRL